MSAIAATTTPRLRGADRRPGFGRLVGVELRKMTDTRAGFWLQVADVVLTVVAAIVVLVTQNASEQTLHHLLYVTMQPLGLLLPVMGVLLVTGEFSQRTALTTFTLVPQRSRVLAAKLAACLVVAGAALVLALTVSVVATAAGSAAWTLPAAMIPQAFLFLATAMLIGAAFGTAVLVSTPAIVVYLVLPTVWNVVVGGIHSLRHIATWLDSSQTLGALSRDPLSASGWAHVAATLALWLTLPLAIGTWRLLHRDVS